MKILLQRKYTGWGDWIMTLTLIKHINIQYPKDEIFVKLYNQTDMVKELFIPPKFDIYCTTIEDTRDIGEFDIAVDHIVYEYSDKKKLIHSMIDKFNKETGLEIIYDPECYAVNTVWAPAPLPMNYIVMPSCGKSVSQRGKEWGYANFNRLCKMLREDISVVQVGIHADPRLEGAIDRVGIDLSHFHYVLMNAKFIVSQVNGLMVYAGVHRFNDLAIYCGSEDHLRCWFPNQVPLLMTEVKQVYESIISNIK